MSAIGTKRTSVFALRMSAFGGKADIAPASQNVPLMTQSGHQLTLPVTSLAALRSPVLIFRRGNEATEFITLVGGAAIAWAPGARAQTAKQPTVGFLGAGMSSAWPWVKT